MLYRGYCYGIQEYLANFGEKIVKSDVIYERFSTGPFKSKLNGVRKYQADISELKLNMGTFYILDGRKIKVFFRGK